MTDGVPLTACEEFGNAYEDIDWRGAEEDRLTPGEVAVLSRVRAHIVPEADLVSSWGMGLRAAISLDGLRKRRLVSRREEVTQFIRQEGFPKKPGPWIIPTKAGTTRMPKELDIGFPPSGNWLAFAGVTLNHQPPDLLMRLIDWFGEACKRAGLKGYNAHGLRKLAATRLAMNGATVHELNAVFGWTGSKMALRYVALADRARLAASGAAKNKKPEAVVEAIEDFFD